MGIQLGPIVFYIDFYKILEYSLANLRWTEIWIQKRSSSGKKT